MKLGTNVVMTQDAVENYGAQWEGVVMQIVHVATKYMPAKEFFAKGKPQGYHPGYDESGGKLFDLVRVDNNNNIPFSLYEFEVTPV